MDFTRQPDCPADSCGDPEVRAALERAGWRCTRQRQAVLCCLRAVATHPTAEQVFAAVRQEIPNISLATVYKALEALVDAGLAARVPDGAGPTRYDGRSEHHYHFRCLETGCVLDVPLPYDAQLLERMGPGVADSLARAGFEVTGHRLELLGRIRPS
jgi:Fe2+ or Zn2+ uptake regulation protein